MSVLLTGAFGNVRESAVLPFLKSEQELVCFDLLVSYVLSQSPPLMTLPIYQS